MRTLKVCGLGLLLAGVGLLPAWRAAGAQGAQRDVARSLKEMADLEARIEQAQRQQHEEQRRLLDASRSLESVTTTLEQKRLLNQEGEAFLKNYGEQARAGLAELEARQANDRQVIAAARTGLTLAQAGLLAAPPAVPAADLLALALLQSTHHDRLRIATEEILDLEARRARFTVRSAHAERSAQYQSVFSEYSVQQLRQRHEALAHQVAEAQAQTDRQTREVRQLASRHEELKSLIGRLAEQEATRAAEATPTLAVTPLPTPLPAPAVAADTPPTTMIPAATLAPAPQQTRPAGDGLGEVPYENEGEPMVSALRTGQDKDQTDANGTRYLFWRASPVGVRALVAGKVLFSGPFAGYRHLLIVDHGSGWRALYGNMVECGLAPGAALQSGQLIGQYQAVQDSRAEPLWFEVRQGVEAVAPATLPAIPAQWQAHLLAPLAAQATAR